MITSTVQRWRAHRGSYRPAREVLDTRRYEIEPLGDDRTARAFIEAHHYSASYPAARFRFALREGERLVGLAVFSQPMNEATFACIPGERLARVELGRFVLLDEVAANAETWMLARCFAELRRASICGVVSFSDPEPRRTIDGTVVFPGHVGTIYQAHNATYLGRARAEHLLMFADGTTLHRRARQKLLNGERGWRYVADRLIEHGARPLERGESTRAWALEWIPRLTHKVRHGGNHKYAWALEPALRRHLPTSLPYPKFAPAERHVA